jgi:hypothetical protein
LGRHSQKLLDGVLALIPSEPRSFVVTTCLLHLPLDGEVDLSTGHLHLDSLVLNSRVDFLLAQFELQPVVH